MDRLLSIPRVLVLWAFLSYYSTTSLLIRLTYRSALLSLPLLPFPRTFRAPVPLTPSDDDQADPLLSVTAYLCRYVFRHACSRFASFLTSEYTEILRSSLHSVGA